MNNNNNNTIYTRQELLGMNMPQLRTVCQGRGVTPSRGKEATIDRILAHQQQQERPGERPVQVEGGDAALRHDGEAPGGLVNAAPIGGPPSGPNEVQGTSREPQVGEKRPFSALQYEELARKYSQQQEDIQGMARELEYLKRKELAEKRWPDRDFKKPKLQHEYDALRDAGRALFHLTHSGSMTEIEHWAAETQKILEERGQVVVTAEEEGWGVASQLHEEEGTFLEDRKDNLKEARKKARKKASTPSGKFFPTLPTSSYQKKWGQPSLHPESSQYSSPRTGKPAMSTQSQAPPHVKCWKCKGNHYRSQCPSNKNSSQQGK
jgi:hypothetical protein